MDKATRSIEIHKGFPDDFRKKAAELYDQAFGQKFSRAIACQAKRIDIFADGISPQFSISAWKNDNLVGLTGFQLKEGSFTGNISWELFKKHLNFLAAIKAALFLSLFERKRLEGILQMDGIVVHPEYRGHGIGTKLLEDLKIHAQSLGYQAITLDVINTNPRAKSLYERMGFKTTKKESYPWLKPLLGFGSSETMVLKLK